MADLLKNTHGRDGGAPSLGSAFTLCNSAIGAGVLSLPYAVSQAGAVGGLLIILLVGLLEGVTLFVLSKFAEKYNAASYGQLVDKALGRKLSSLLSVVMIVYFFGSCVAYMIIVGDTFGPIFSQLLGQNSWFADRQLIIVAVSLLVIFPLCLPRTLRALAPVSAFAVFGFILAAILIFARSWKIVHDRSPKHRFEDVVLFHWDFKALYAIPIVVFGFNCHANVVGVFYELSGQPGRVDGVLPTNGILSRSSSKVIRMLGVILASSTITMVGYVLVGVAAYLAFPNWTNSDVLNAFSRDDIYIQIARVLVGLVIISHYPLNHAPARRGMEDLATQFLGWSEIPKALSISFTAVYVLGVMAVALLVMNLSTVLHFIGGTAACYMIFFLPGLLLVNGAVVEDSNHQLAQGLHIPLLEGTPHGLRKAGLVYSSRKSWWGGLLLVLLAVGILVITLLSPLV